MYQTSEFDAQIFCFRGTTHKTGHFWIPEEIKKAMNWPGDGWFGFLVFDSSGKLQFRDKFETK